jgi:hypothetical protein
MFYLLRGVNHQIDLEADGGDLLPTQKTLWDENNLYCHKKIPCYLFSPFCNII